LVPCRSRRFQGKTEPRGSLLVSEGVRPRTVWREPETSAFPLLASLCREGGTLGHGSGLRPKVHAVCARLSGRCFWACCAESPLRGTQPAAFVSRQRRASCRKAPFRRVSSKGTGRLPCSGLVVRPEALLKGTGSRPSTRIFRNRCNLSLALHVSPFENWRLLRSAERWWPRADEG